MTTLSLRRVDTIALGNFNPAILQPPWFQKHGLLEAEPAQLEFRPDGLRFRLGPVGWSAGPTQLMVVVEAEADAELQRELAERPAGVMRRVFELLHHTPVSAIGHNFMFVCDPPPGSWFANALAAISVSRPASAEPFQLQVRYHGVVQGAAVAVTYFPAEHAKRIAFNVHRVVGSSHEAVSAATRGTADLVEIRAWAESLLRP